MPCFEKKNKVYSSEHFDCKNQLAKMRAASDRTGTLIVLHEFDLEKAGTLKDERFQLRSVSLSKR